MNLGSPQKKVNCIIVDDEPLARDVMENFIGKISALEHIASCSSAIEAFDVMNRYSVDLIFLDVQMPDLNGLDFLKNLNLKPVVVFTTAYSDYALEAYNLNAVDYLMKPIEFSRFLQAIHKVVNHFQGGKSSNQNYELPNQEVQQHIYLKVEKTIQKIDLRDVLYIESLRNYIRVITDRKEIIGHKTISSIMNMLPFERFMRVHRSFIISIDQIDSFSPVEIEIKGKKIPVGRKYKQDVKKRLGYF